MDASMFDPASFLNQETDEAATRRPPLDPGEYDGVITDLKPRKWTSGDGTKSGIAFDPVLEITVPSEQVERIGMPVVKLSDSLFIDVTEQGMLDFSPGKNGGLRRYREATGQNKPGKPWSPQKLVGQPLKVNIGHRVIEKGPDTGEVVEQIKGVAKI